MHTSSVSFAAGNVSIGFMQATPGDMKSFRSSAERIALIATSCARCAASKIETGSLSLKN
jgi:hypothetical protein